jgi:ribosomal protein S27AE
VICPRCGDKLIYESNPGATVTTKMLYCPRCGMFGEDYEQKLRNLKQSIQGITHDMYKTGRIMEMVMRVIRNE